MNVITKAWIKYSEKEISPRNTRRREDRNLEIIFEFIITYINNPAPKVWDINPVLSKWWINEYIVESIDTDPSISPILFGYEPRNRAVQSNVDFIYLLFILML